MRAISNLAAALVAALFVGTPVMAAQAPNRPDFSEAGDFEKREFKSASAGGEGESRGGLTTLKYRLLRPEGRHEGKRPLVVFLHGAGERGDDNHKQLAWGRAFLRAAAKQGCYVVVPQCPERMTWGAIRRNAAGRAEADEQAAPPAPQRLVVELIVALTKEFDLDTQRLYITGLSMGGFGTWDLIQRHPTMFAAAIPICGGGAVGRADRMTSTPIWAFHGDKDETVPVDRSRQMVEAVKKAGGDVRYTEYPGVGHDSWVKAYAEPELLEWMLKQRRK